MYNYEKMKPQLFLPENSEEYLRKCQYIHDKFRQRDEWCLWELLGTGDSWFSMTVVYYLCEQGWLEETTAPDYQGVSNYRTFKWKQLL